MPRPYPPISYHDYLGLDQLLSCQHPKSAEHNKPAHDEMLFITVHQTYELWFKQILIELDSVLSLFGQKHVADSNVGVILARLLRVIEIQKVLISHLDVLETMTPMDFLEFREYLYPASGFQSLQFRLIENKLGLKPQTRLRFNQNPYYSYLPESHRQILLKTEESPSLFDLIEKWLERTPFLQLQDFDFWKSYQKAVREMFAADKRIVEGHTNLSADEKARNLAEITKSEQVFTALFDEKSYRELQAQGQWRISYKALHAALLIQLYREQPILQLPCRILQALLDIDELFTAWRYRHALMAQRMLGSKIGTGGSSGHKYLKEATEQHKIFSDFFALATFYIPRSALPPLPNEVIYKMGFVATNSVSELV